MSFAFTLIAAYLLGSLPTGYLTARRLKGVDVRTLGSGNIGATNVARVIGKRAGLFVLLVDTVKGTLAVTLLPTLMAQLAGAEAPAHWRLWSGLAVVIGHDWCCWLYFRGGKGIATSLGVLLGLAPAIAGWCAVAWFLTFALSRLVALSSIVASVALPLSLLALRYPGRWVLVGSLLGCIAIMRHNTNIKRMLQKTEQKFTPS